MINWKSKLTALPIPGETKLHSILEYNRASRSATYLKSIDAGQWQLEKQGKKFKVIRIK